MSSTIIDGTRNVLEIARRSRARLLFLSSGAIYGPQIAPVREDNISAPSPLDPNTAYGQSKRVAEMLCAAATAAGEVEAVVARLFAFIGPRIPLDGALAAGNFLNDALHGRAIHVNGDGRPMRSYLYTGDLSQWCWAILTRGALGSAYNVGSPEAVSINELALATAGLVAPRIEVVVAEAPGDEAPPWYVPSVERAATELNLGIRTNLEEALQKTFDWLNSK